MLTRQRYITKRNVNKVLNTIGYLIYLKENRNFVVSFFFFIYIRFRTTKLRGVCENGTRN